jgi:hypothetical protein
MAAEQELLAIAKAIEDISGRFVKSRSLGLHLRSIDKAEFKRLTVESKSILDAELGRANDFSVNLIHSINTGSDGFLGGPSLASVQEAQALINGAVNHIRRKDGLNRNSIRVSQPLYVDSSRLAELRASISKSWDTIRLVRLCEELNITNENACYMSVAMLVRSIADHVPPIFGCKNFNEVANNYSGADSFRRSMKHLNTSLRNIADAHLHVQIRKTETLPTEQQVNFRADLDVLLSEVVRLLK